MQCGDDCLRSRNFVGKQGRKWPKQQTVDCDELNVSKGPKAEVTCVQAERQLGAGIGLCKVPIASRKRTLVAMQRQIVMNSI